MKQFKLTALRKAILLLVTIMLVSCLTIAFVACNDDNDDSSNGEFSISLDTIDSATLNQALNGMIGYSHAHKNEYNSAYIYCLLKQDSEQTVCNEVSLLSLDLYNFDKETNESTDSLYCHLLFFKSEQDAQNNLNAVKNEFPDSIITPISSVIVIEHEEGLYNSIKSSTLPETSTFKAQLNFFNNAFKKETNLMNNRGVEISIIYKVDITSQLYILPNQGNIYRSYVCSTADHWEELMVDDTFLCDLTSDSYVKKSDGIYYAYMQPKSGFTFDENSSETGYIINGYYYKEAPETLVIPAIYNGKPIVEILMMEIPDETTTLTIPSSICYLPSWILENAENLKTINYQGTMEQWKALGIELSGLTVNCTDDDKQDDNEDTSGINVKTLWNKIIGFVLSAKSRTECGFDFYNNGNNVEDMFGTNSTGYIYAYNTEHIVYIAFYDTDEHAQENISFVETTWNDLDLGQQFVVKQEKNALIMDGNGESYNALINSTIPDGVISDKTFEFMTKNTLLTLSENLSRVYAGFGCGLYVSEDGYVYNCTQISTNNAFSVEYEFYTNEEDFYNIYPTDIINQIGTKYTTDSYITFNEDGIYVCLIKNPNYTES